jgi:Asp-tRNA(Asn)/Glu-tRNA(Gln) amidotransferase B subunit
VNLWRVHVLCHHPDRLPRSYQISQYDQPLAEAGELHVALPVEDGGGVCRVGVTRAHLEEARRKRAAGAARCAALR